MFESNGAIEDTRKKVHLDCFLKTYFLLQDAQLKRQSVSLHTTAYKMKMGIDRAI